MCFLMEALTRFDAECRHKGAAYAKNSNLYRLGERHTQRRNKAIAVFPFVASRDFLFILKSGFA